MLMDENGENVRQLENYITEKTPCYFPPKRALKNLKKGGIWVHGITAIYRREVLIDEGGFNPELGYFCDGLMHQVLALRHGACFIPEYLGCWRLSGSSYSTMSRDDEQNSIVLKQVYHLMRTAYSDVYPPAYVAYLELYEAVGPKWGRFRHEQDRIIDESLLPLMSRSFLRDTLFTRGVRLFSKAQTLLLMFYLSIRSKMVRV